MREIASANKISTIDLSRRHITSAQSMPKIGWCLIEWLEVFAQSFHFQNSESVSHVFSWKKNSYLGIAIKTSRCRWKFASSLVYTLQVMYSSSIIHRFIHIEQFWSNTKIDQKFTKIGWQNLVFSSSLMSSLALFNWSGSEATDLADATVLKLPLDTRTNDCFYKNDNPEKT